MWYDFVTLGVLVYSTFRGAVKGIVWQLASISALLLCFVFAAQLSVVISPHIAVAPPLNRWIAMAVIYGLFSFASFAAARVLRGWIEKARFVEYDRHLGGILGFLKGATLSLLLTFFVVTLSTSAREQVLNSYSGHAAAIVMDRLHPVMPHELHDVLEPYIHQLDRPDLDLKHAHEGANGKSAPISVDADGNASDSANSRSPGGPPPDPADDANELERIAELQQIVASLPGIFDAHLRTLVLRALENTSDADRAELLTKLRSGIPGLVRMIAIDWQGGKPVSTTNGADASARAGLLKEIGAVYSDFPDAQETVVEEIEWALVGVPDQVTLPLLRDWHADLLALHPDPDPATDMMTSLDARILRQLTKAGIPLTSLSSSLRDRLRESLPR
jgi:membrane protein required for colicin V production